jgi:hypothetical protein
MSLGNLLELDAEDKVLIERDLFINIKAGRLTLGPDPDSCYQILQMYNLEGLMAYIDCFNPSRAAPYHGAFHEAALVSLVYEAARFYGFIREETRVLLIAAAMHDFNHSADKAANDSENIEAAIAGLHQAQKHLLASSSPILPNEATDAEHLIRITEYPYTTNAQTLVEKIMRDADLMMPYLPTPAVKSLFVGLKEEMETCKGKRSFTEFASGVKEFYSNVIWGTEWAVAKAKVNQWDEKLSMIYNLLANHTQPTPEAK